MAQLALRDLNAHRAIAVWTDIVVPQLATALAKLVQAAPAPQRQLMIIPSAVLARDAMA